MASLKHELFYLQQVVNLLQRKTINLTRILFVAIIYLTFNCICIAQNNTPLFTVLSSAETNVTFTNIPFQRPSINILTYSYYFNGGGVAVGDINNDGLQDIYFTSNSTSGNKLYLNKGNFKFEDITEKSGVKGNCDWCSGVTMADVNGDGYLDIYVSAITTIFDFKGSNQLFINNGDNTFTDRAEEYGLNIKGTITQSAFFDYDHDGDLDCFILSQSMMSNMIVKDAKARNTTNYFFKSRLLRNELSNGQKKFTDVSTQANIFQSGIGYGLGISIADINNDGWDDIYIGNDFFEDDYYYVNNGNGTFTESGKKHFSYYSQNSMGNDIADYNNDGQLDVITVDMLANEEKLLKQYSIEDQLSIYNYKYINNGYHHQLVSNCLHTNNGNGDSFSENTLLSGISATDWSWAPLFADFDNDGNKDLFVSAGITKNLIDADFIKYREQLSPEEQSKPPSEIQSEMLKQMPDGFSHPFLFKGTGTLLFKNMSDEWGTKKLSGCYNGAAYADLNNDGNLDLVINCVNTPAVVLKNNSTAKNYITFSLKANGLNTNAIGAKVYVFNKNKIQYQQLMLTRGFQSSVEPRLHFGLGENSVVDSILIVWPDQKMQVLKNLEANKTITINKTEGLVDFNYKIYFPKKQDEFEDITEKINLNYKHSENDFLDYYIQPLIPHALSKRGPKVAVGDVNNDGTEDFFICGASSQAGTLILQNKNGSFLKSNTTEFNADSLCEDVDATFFDADNDKDLDLYVVSGGNQFTRNNPALLDRLYINDGKGNFKKQTEAIPKIYQDKSCIAIADIDNDGDNDIFCGGFTDANKYGVAQNSYLLLNNGKGIFSVQQKIFDSLGMVTSAEFADVNNDGYTDLVVVGEWMLVTIFINNKGIFTKTEIPQSSGLWQCVSVTDLNNDGNLDILAGNWGHNTKFWSGKTSPLRLYVGDFNKSGNQSQLLTYMSDGVEYSFLGKEQIERKLPSLKKKFLHFKDFSSVPFQQSLGDFVKSSIPLKAEILGSSIFYGDGKGSFKLNEMPDSLQLAPISIFLKNKTNNEFLAGGNYYDLSPYEGRYDAQPLALFNITNNKVYRNNQINLDAIRGQVKDLKWINTIKYGNVLIVVRNNDSLLFYKPIK